MDSQTDATHDIHPMPEKLRRKKSFSAARSSLLVKMGQVASLSKTPFRSLFKSSKTVDDHAEPVPPIPSEYINNEQPTSMIEENDENDAATDSPVWASSMLIMPRTHYFLFTRAVLEDSAGPRTVQPIRLLVKQPNQKFQLAALRAELKAEPEITTPGVVKLLEHLIQSGKRIVPLVSPDDRPVSAPVSGETDATHDTATTTSGDADFKLTGDLLFPKDVKAWVIVDSEPFAGLTAQYHVLRRMAEGILKEPDQIRTVDGDLKFVHNDQVRGGTRTEGFDETLFIDVTSMITAPIQVGPLARYCNGCSATHVSMSRCVQCKSVFYCGSECQQADWPSHKVICGAVAASNVENGELGSPKLT